MLGNIDHHLEFPTLTLTELSMQTWQHSVSRLYSASLVARIRERRLLAALIGEPVVHGNCPSSDLQGEKSCSTVNANRPEDLAGAGLVAANKRAPPVRALRLTAAAARALAVGTPPSPCYLAL
ncbi:Hypothetical predicted protein [Pelobates cultripes]|uniref:Uncharacterized protein n=1 Tax=Pelobates cultripes TaxID=61616 RepID=A0AAD1W6X5_PELCU|nr:Hypothetical predicted protein [Pelobates cultripes]